MARRRPRNRRAGLAFSLLALTAGLGPAAAQEAAPEAPRLLEGHGGPIKGVAGLLDGAEALTASFDYAIGLWDLEGGTRIAWLEGHNAQVNAVAATPDGRYAVSASDDFSLIVWDLDAARIGAPALLTRMEGHEGKTTQVAIAPGGARAASAGWDGVARIWSLPDGAPLAATPPHGASVTVAAFSPDGRSLLTGAADGRVRRFRAEDAAPVDLMAEQGFAIGALTTGAPTPEEAWAAFGSADGVLRIIALGSGREEARFEGARSPILALAAGPDGRRLAAGDGSGAITLYRRVGAGATASWERAASFTGARRGPVWSLSFAGADRLLASGLDPAAAIWPLDAPAAPPPILASGDAPDFQVDPSAVSEGERHFLRKCSVCHSLAPESGRYAGPTLYGVFGRRAGAVPGYVYSEALAGSDIVWTEETMNALFDLGPDHYTPGSKMPMQRIVSDAERAELIAYLKVATAPDGAAREEAPAE